ncbi:MAG: SGNH/GDSL hydrolase family protein [Candidatus Aminicenantes bacterium]|nr:SGNH/GDSL hydrolase family protein [Candidatus Aminicenantes bacterium]
MTSDRLKPRPARTGLAVLIVFILSFASCARTVRSVIILCAGDSLTEQGYPRFLQRIMRRDGIRARVLNYVRSGFTSGQYLRYARDRTNELSSCRPDYILLQLGTNDVRLDGDRTPTARFEQNMKDIIALFRDFRTRQDRPSLIFLAAIPPVPENSAYPFSSESSRRVKDEINPVLKRLAQEAAVPLVDNYALFVRLPRLLPDIHPSEEGYRELAMSWYRALGPYLPRGR